MAVKNEAFLLLEDSLTSKLDTSMRRGYIPAIKRAASKARGGDFVGAREEVNSIDVTPNIENQRKFITLIGMQSILFGARDFGAAKDTSFFGEPPPDILEVSTDTLILMISINANTRIKKQAHSELDIEEVNQKESTFKIQKAPTDGFVRNFVSSIGTTGQATTNIGSSLHTSRLASWGFTTEAQLSGAISFIVSEVLDGRTCPVCREMNGKVFPVSSAKKKLEGLLNVTDPEELKAIAKWPNQSKAGLASLRSMTDDELIQSGWDTPPYHPLCRGILRRTSKSISTSIPNIPFPRPAPSTVVTESAVVAEGSLGGSIGEISSLITSEELFQALIEN